MAGGIVAVVHLRREVWRAALAAALAAGTLGGPATAAGAESYAFDGVFVPEDTGSYHRLELSVPDGTAEIRVSYAYQSIGPQSELLANVVDIGLYDAENPGFRGWSGSAKSSFTVGLDRERTSDGYVAGPMAAGEWAVELGAGFVAAGTTTAWHVDIETVDGAGPAAEPPPWSDVVLGGPGWYAGDLHCHSTHSDGSYPVADVVAYAHEVGLDFVALTDHNGYTGHADLGVLQASYDDLALLRGMEVTTYRGHANVFALSRYVDYHATGDGFDVDEVLAGVHADGGLVSINHPDHFGAEPAPGRRVSLGWTVEGTDWSAVDFVEVVNGTSVLGGVMSNPLNEAALGRWDELLAAGHRIVAIGGSDDHRAGQGSAAEDFYYAPIGTPTTVVYAPELGEAGILAGLRTGRVYLRTESPAGPGLDLTADCGAGEVVMGGEATGSRCRVVGRVVGGVGAMLELIVDGERASAVEVPADDFSHALVVEPRDETFVRLELRRDGLLLGLTNPVFLRDGPGGYVDPPVVEEGGCTCAVALGRAPWPLRGSTWGGLGLLLVSRCWRRRVGYNPARSRQPCPATARPRPRSRSA